MGVHTNDKGKPAYAGPVVPVPCINPGTEDQVMDNPNIDIFFLENDLHKGMKIKSHFMKNENQKVKFLPRKVADSIPFASNKLPQIYNEFSIKPDSAEAEIIKQTLNYCENKDIQGVDNKCVTSLESMVDFGITSLGKKLKAISTEIKTKKSSPPQKYTVERATKLSSNKSIVCHKKNYAYAVFFCHKSVTTRVYAVSLMGVDGTKVKAVAVCYTDTANWSPKQLAFLARKVKPGSMPVCHFLSENHVVWVPY
ncbi:BURP domain protein RD22-like protein [Tanacetum coccineum]